MGSYLSISHNPSLNFTSSVDQCKEEGRNVLINDVLHTLYYGYPGHRDMVNNHINSEIENLLLHSVSYSFRLTARTLLHALPQRQDNTYHGLFVIPVVGHWLK